MVFILHPFLFLFLCLSLLHDFVNLANVDMGTKELEPVTTKEAKGPLPAAQDVEIQTRISQTTLRPGGLSLSKEKDTVMEEASKITITDLGSRLPAFLTRFNSLDFNNLLASHFHRFGPPCTNFLRFSVLVEGLPLLEGLFKVHGDFTSEFRGGVFLGNILMELLYAVLVSLKDTPLDSLSEEKRLLE